MSTAQVLHISNSSSSGRSSTTTRRSSSSGLSSKIMMKKSGSASSLFRRLSRNGPSNTTTTTTTTGSDHQSRAVSSPPSSTTTTAGPAGSQNNTTAPRRLTTQSSLAASESSESSNSSSSCSEGVPVVPVQAAEVNKATPTVSSKTSGRPPRSILGKLRRKSSSQAAAAMSTVAMTTTSNSDNDGTPAAENVIQWLEAMCPNDVVPKVLAYCGPTMMATLMKTNRYWFHLIAKEDATWRPLCEGLYKWKEGRDKPPHSWKHYYRTHPCVPIDYSTIPKALAVATACPNKKKKGVVRHYHNNREQIKSVHILLRPGKHYIRESLVIEAAPCITVRMETMELPANRHYNPRLALEDQRGPQSCPEQRLSRASSLRQLMSCKSQSAEAATATDNTYDSDGSESLVAWNEHSHNSSHHYSTEPPKYPERASLILQTKKANEPVIRVQQGAFHLKRVDLYHACNGVDIWTGQTALQVQPPLGPDDQPLTMSNSNTGGIPRPWATVHNCSITSKSGRGVVCLDGGYLTMRESLVYQCAATGIYIGGPGSQADIEQTDVVRNGIGSRLPPSRAPRVSSGHSGVYLEQGMARLHACNVSSNFLTGISSISPDNAVLMLQKSDLIANGQCNLEMPPPGTPAFNQSIIEDNHVASVGRPCLRSNLELPTRASAPF